MKDTFLSVDLDYWVSDNYAPIENIPDPDWFLDQVLATGLPVHLSIYHRDMMPWLVKHPSKVIVNVDDHEDFSGSQPRNITPRFAIQNASEGGLFGHVPWREQAKYCWVCARSYQKYCRQVRTSGMDEKSGRFWHPTAWYRERITTTNWEKAVDFSRVQAVAIAICPDYSSPKCLGTVPERLGITHAPCHGWTPSRIRIGKTPFVRARKVLTSKQLEKLSAKVLAVEV